MPSLNAKRDSLLLTVMHHEVGSTRDQDRTRRSYRMTKRDATSLHTHNISGRPCCLQDRGPHDRKSLRLKEQAI